MHCNVRIADAGCPEGELGCSDASQRPDEEPASGGITVTQNNVVLLPSGPSVPLTGLLQKLVKQSKGSNKQEDARFYRQILEHLGGDGHSPLAFLNDTVDEARRRILKLLEDVGFEVGPPDNIHGNLAACYRGDHPNYKARLIPRSRSFYRALIEDKLFSHDQNPAEVDGWHLWSSEQRQKFAEETTSNVYARKHAGGRIFLKERDRYAGKPQDPTGVADEIRAAVAESDAPESIKIITDVLVESGARISGILRASAQDWSASNFKNFIEVKTKYGRVECVDLSEEAEDWLRNSFTDREHPNNPGRTYMDYLHELKKQGRKKDLREIYLFTVTKSYDNYSYSGFRYWFQDCMLAQGVLVDGMVPGPHFLRNCKLDLIVKAIFDSFDPGRERDKRLKEAAQEFGHNSLAWKFYVRHAIGQERIRIQREKQREQKAREQALRDGGPPPPRKFRLSNPVAEARHAKLPSRPLQ